MKYRILLPALIAVAAPVFLSAQETQTGGAMHLKPRFYPGKAYNYVTNTVVKMQLPGRPGQPAPAERQVSMEHHARLAIGTRSGANPGVSVDASTDRLKLEIAAGEKQIVYDSKDADASESKEAQVLARHFDGATRRTMALELDENGKIVKAEEQGGGGSATPLPGVPQFGPDQLKQLVGGMIQGFPPDPVKPGDEWVQKGKRSLGQFGEIDFEITYRYARDEEFEGANCARIEYTGAIKGDVAVSGANPGSAPGRLGFEGTELTGRLMFDKARSAVRLSEQKVKMTIDAPVAGSDTGTVRLPMNQTVTSKLVSVKDA